MVSLYKSVSLLLLVSVATTTLTAQVRDVWQNLSGNYLTITEAPDNPQHLFAAGVDGHILTSRDEGASWTSNGLRSGFVEDPVTGLAAMGGDTLLATTLLEQSAFWRSIDGGDTWTKIETAIPIQGGSRAQYVAPQVAILGGDQNGATMLTRDGGLSIDTIQQLGYYIFSGGDGILMGVQTAGASAQVIRSTSFGESWDTVTTAAAFNGSIRIFHGYTFHIKDADHFVISANKEADYLVTTDGGLSFSAGTIPGNDIKKIIWLSDTDLISYDENKGAAISSDGGLTWTVDTDVSPVGSLTALHAAAHVTSAGTKVVATTNELYTQTAGASDWTLSRAQLESTRIGQFEVADKQTAYFRYNNTNRPNFSAAYVTKDAGASWQPLEGSGPAIHTQPNGIVFASRNTKIDRSTDFGETWTEVYGGVGFTPVFEMIAPNNDLLIAVTASGFLHSTDNGLTWTVQFASGFGHAGGINSIAVIDAATYVVSSGNDNTFKVNITRDTGRTFTDINPGIPGGRTTGQVAAANGRIYLTPFFMSEDLGTTWERLDQRDTFGTTRYERVYFRTGTEGFFSEFDGNGFVAYTENAGRNFQETRTSTLGVGAGVRAMAFADENRTHGFASSTDIFRYEDGEWPVLQAVLNQTSNIRGEAITKKIQAWPNPASPGDIIQLGYNNKLEPKIVLISPIGQIITSLNVSSGAVTLPLNIAPGLYTLVDIKQGTSSRILISNQN